MELKNSSIDEILKTLDELDNLLAHKEMTPSMFIVLMLISIKFSRNDKILKSFLTHLEEKLR